MQVQLSAGAIEAVLNGQTCENLKPVIQILGLKKMQQPNSTQERYRLLISDGRHSNSSAMLASQLNDLVSSGRVASNCVVRLNKYVCNQIGLDRKIIMVLEVEVLKLASEVAGKIGNPVPLKQSGSESSSEPAETTAPGILQQKLQNQPVVPTSDIKSESTGIVKLAYSSVAASGPVLSVKGSAFGMQPTLTGSRSPAAGRNTNAPGNLPRTPGGSVQKTFPIMSLTPYQNKWTIRARVSQKSAVRTYSNSRGEGKFFNVNLVDESGEIRATAWKTECDKFFDLLEMNKVYYVSRAMLKPANKQYSSVNNDYEMTFTGDTQITVCEDEDSAIPAIQFSFVQLAELNSKQPNSLVDVIGVVKSTGDITCVLAKSSQKEVTKRDVELVDDSNYAVRLTLWGDDARNFDGTGNPVLAVKGCRLSDWNGRSLSALSSSTILINPDIAEAHPLRGWYDASGAGQTFSSFQSDGAGAGGAGTTTSWKTFDEMKNESLGSGDKADYFMVKATIIFMKKENCMYMACPSEGCNKKLIDNGNSLYRCEKCSRESPDYKWRMILQANLADITSNQWVTCFQESAETVLGEKADVLGNMRHTEEARFDALFQDAMYKTYVFKLRAKMETYNDENRVKVVCMDAKPVNLVENNKKLIHDIETLAAAL